MDIHLINSLPNDLIYKIAIDLRPKKCFRLVPIEDKYIYPCIENNLLSCEYIENISTLKPRNLYKTITYLAKTERKDLLIQVSMNIDKFKKRSIFLYMVFYNIPIEPFLDKHFFQLH